MDASQIRQVLWNLLKNAAEAMDGPGRIDVESAVSDAGDALMLTVTDDGTGVSNPEAIFEPFYTTRAQGTGLGLAVVARIVREHSRDGFRSGTFRAAVRASPSRCPLGASRTVGALS